ncbi:phosphatase PAP2 family protein [Devosia limi]|uniref:Undecaprenyl-diphosphatase n=1 Tax=Devosia limi DSM 17137 TaxID=1121477 RepID=A0A1M5BV51_9HYPH|nr:phosphatase PAP2 family protein [Devosia limi]SHF46444.1 undecaprenyl-diphosphatase [Devosia limi DSM 17137]
MFDLTKPWPLGLSRRTWPAFCAGIVLVLLVLASIDAWASQGAINWPDAWRAPFFFITDYGLSDWILIPSMLVFLLARLAMILLRRLPRLAAFEVSLVSGFIFLGVAMPGLFVAIVKRLIGRGRPDEFEASGQFAFHHIVNAWNFQSFPSGHTTTAIAFAFAMGFLMPRLFPWLLALGVAAGISRVPVGMHYPTDVFGGLIVGMLGAYLVRNWFAARSLLFIKQADGRIVRRPLVALPRLFQRARA